MRFTIVDSSIECAIVSVLRINDTFFLQNEEYSLEYMSTSSSSSSSSSSSPFSIFTFEEIERRMYSIIDIERYDLRTSLSNLQHRSPIGCTNVYVFTAYMHVNTCMHRYM